MLHGGPEPGIERIEPLFAPCLDGDAPAFFEQILDEIWQHALKGLTLKMIKPDFGHDPRPGWRDFSRSTDRHQAFGEAPPVGAILCGAVAQAPGRRFIEGTHKAGRAADNQAIIGKLLAFGHQGIGADETIAADSGAVQKRRAIPMRLFSPIAQPCRIA